MVSPFPRLKTAVVIFVLILGNTSPVHPTADLAATIASAATLAINSGGTLAGKTLQHLAATDHKVTCVIQVENWTRYALLYATPRLSGGGVTSPPTAILPSKREAFATRKTTGSYHGVWGTVSWLVRGVNRRFVLMWSIPYDYERYANWMALGMTRTGVTGIPQGGDRFNHMYYGESDSNLTFIRHEFYRTTDPIIYRDDKFEIVGIMTNVGHGEIRVTFRPSENNKADLSPQIQELMKNPNKCPACNCKSQ